MPWWSWKSPPTENAPIAEVGVEPNAVTAAATLLNTMSAGRTQIVPKYDSWQEELWAYYDSLGEFNIAVSWRSYMISRVRLRAAKLKPGSDEPEIVDSGPAADLVNELFAGTSGQSAMLSTLSVLLDVPAEAWLVGEAKNDGGSARNAWKVVSSDEIRKRGQSYEVITDDSIEGHVSWRKLGENSFVTRVWRPHKRLHYMPYSPAYAARTAMRELELVNRHIIAQYLSRLASAGIILFPDEVTFPSRPEFMDAADPFILEWITMASEAIKNPGAASSIVPMPFKVPSEYVDKVKHIDFTLKIDEKIIEKRDSARNRLATMINVPAELLFQAADVNHWGLWQLEEGAIRTYISPDVELMVNALTVGYLHPRLKALNENPDEWVIWYDASELAVRPDKSAGASDAYDRLELSGKALRRELGFDEDDAPTNDELIAAALRKMIVNPQLAVAALEELTGVKLNVEVPEPPMGEDVIEEDDDVPSETDDEPDDGPPNTGLNQPPAPEAPGGASASVINDAFTILQAKTDHVIEFNVTGWQLKHPLLCQPKLFSCPFTHVTYEGLHVHPGTSGNYACRLSARGEFIIGERVFPSGNYIISNPPLRQVNGARQGA